MNRRIPKAPSKLRIWQKNTHKAKLAQQYLLNSANPEEWDVIAIQEPWLDLFKRARGSAYWRILYPTNHFSDGASHTCSLLMINTNISTDSYTQLDVPSSNITAACFIGPYGNLTLFNIYNNCNHNDSLLDIAGYLSSHPPTPSDNMLWLGDFNRHHPLWESPENRHLNSSEDKIRPLLDLIRDYDMTQILPPNTSTYETTNHNWTRPDNVWLSHQALDLYTACYTHPTIRPTHADHLPIVTIIDILVERSLPKPSPNFCYDFYSFTHSFSLNYTLDLIL